MRHFSRWATLLLAVFTLSVSLTVAAPSQQASVGGYAAHALVLQTDSTGATTLASYRPVMQTAPLISMDSGRMSSIVSAATNPARAADHADHHDTDAVVIQLLDDASSAVVYQTVLNIPSAIRGEFHFDPENPTRVGFNGSNIVRYDVPLETRTFPVRLPIIAGATQVNVQPLYGTRAVSRIDLNAATGVSARASDLDPIHDIPPTVYTLSGYSDGPVDNRVDVLIMGDGYTQSQLTKFKNDAKTFADAMFSITPYKTYKSFFNIRAVYGPSKQSGADRPPFNANCVDDGNDDNGIACCRDNNPSWSAQTRSTRYNSTFCWSQIARLMVTGDSDKVFADADAAYADWDEIWIIVNDTTYGGSGGELAAASINQYGVQIQQHEVGHTLMRLADEYGGGATTIFCDDIAVDGYDCPPNVTNVKNRAALKWNYWVNASTSIPTSSPLSDATAAGLWRGAVYSNTAAYRACYDCIMRTLGRPFGKVAAERLPIVLYQGGWEGAFADSNPPVGVSMVDSFSPTNDSPWSLPTGGTLDLSAWVVGPTGKKIQTVWLLNGTPIKTERLNPGTLASYTFTPVSAHDDSIITLQVSDIHATLHPINRILSQTEISWTVDAAGAPNAPIDILGEGGFETVSPTSATRALGWTQNTNLKGGRKCGDGLAHLDACYYQLQAKNSKIGTLKRLLPADVAPYADAGDLLILSGYFNTINLTGTFEVVATLVWSDSSKTKITLPALSKTSGGYVLKETRYQLLSSETRTLSSFDVTLRFKKPGGKVLADGLMLLNYADFLPPIR